MERTHEEASDTCPSALRVAHGACITRVLLRQVLCVADECGARTIFVSGEALTHARLPEELLTGRHRILYVVGRDRGMTMAPRDGETILSIPDVPLTRMSQVKIAAILALGLGLIGHGDVVIFLTGQAGSGVLDTLCAMEVGREAELFHYIGDLERIPKSVRPEVVARVLDLATELGAEGREGRPVGALFVVGDSERVMGLTRPLVLNPFYGYQPEHRNILDARMEETVKEFSSIDGAFVIRGDGVMEACGVFLKTTAGGDLPQGLGTRHHVAAGITAVTDSIAVAVSQSTGTVTLFRGGHILTDILRSRWLGRSREKSGERLDPEAAASSRFPV